MADRLGKKLSEELSDSNSDSVDVRKITPRVHKTRGYRFARKLVFGVHDRALSLYNHYETYDIDLKYNRRRQLVVDILNCDHVGGASSAKSETMIGWNARRLNGFVDHSYKCRVSHLGRVTTIRSGWKN